MKIGINVPQSTSKWSANFQLKRSKVKVTGRQQTPHQSGDMFTYGRRIKRRRLRRRLQTIGLTIVRPNWLSTPETLDNCTDGCISCRHSAPTSFLAYLVSAVGVAIHGIVCAVVIPSVLPSVHHNSLCPNSLGLRHQTVVILIHQSSLWIVLVYISCKNFVGFNLWFWTNVSETTRRIQTYLLENTSFWVFN